MSHTQRTSLKAKVLLIIANTRWNGKRPFFILPHAALLLTALLKEDFDFAILDANGKNLIEEECQKQIGEKAPDIILLSGQATEYWMQYETVFRMAKSVAPEAKTIFGGVHPTVMPEEVMRDTNVDYAFLGHAEERVSDFIKLVLAGDIGRIASFSGVAWRDGNGKVQINPVKSYISQIKKLVDPDYSVLNIEPYLVRNTMEYQGNSSVRSVPVTTSYGCNFCATKTISGKGIAFRTVSSILKEMDMLVQRYEIKEVLFLDDLFLADRKRVVKLLNAIIEIYGFFSWKPSSVSAWHLDDDLLELMKKSGCKQITVSVESGSQRVLDEIIRKPLNLKIIPPIVKKCRELGIAIGANFVIGFPGETWQDIRESVACAEQMDFDVVHFHIATPLPKTELYETARKMGALPENFSFLNHGGFGFSQAFLTTDEFTPNELMILRAYEYDRINFATPEKEMRVAKLYGKTVEQMREHRKQTRRKLGVHFG